MKKDGILMAIFMLLIALGGYWYIAENQYKEALIKTVSTDKNRIKVNIEKGESAKDIGKTLWEKGVVVSEGAFVRYIKEKGYDTKIKSGDYVLFTNDTIPTIADVLVGQTIREVSLTIPEGYTVKQIDALLKKKGLVKGSEFIDCMEKCTFDVFSFLSKNKGLEGFLFPNTYFIDGSSFTPESFTERLLTIFDRQIAPYKKDIPAGKMYDIITMASLIERETRTDEERPVVAGILWKRVENNWYLGVDATLRYYKDDWVNEISYSDLQDNNPYNTRKNIGLPPTPICNPGIASIKAAIYPVKSDYWYYLHDKEGHIHYAKTLAEHEQNKIKYLY